MLPWILFGYALGSVPFAFLVARRAGIDVRIAGSGNVGAANVLRLPGPCQRWDEYDADFIREILDLAGDKWSLLVSGAPAAWSAEQHTTIRHHQHAYDTSLTPGFIFLMDSALIMPAVCGVRPTCRLK